MDVRCERCKTDYVFDDALVGGEGTRVKCTRCGHAFAVRHARSEGGDDVWHVLTGDGRTLIFASLREVRGAIEGGRVEPDDLFSRGALPPKPLRDVGELAVFFAGRAAFDTKHWADFPPPGGSLEATAPSTPVPTLGPSVLPARTQTQPGFPPPDAQGRFGQATRLDEPDEQPAPRPSLPELRSPPVRRSVGGYVVGVVVFAAAAWVFATWARGTHFGTRLSTSGPETAKAASSVAEGVAEKEGPPRAGTGSGGLPATFEPGTLLATDAPGAAIEAAHRAAVQADEPWLLLRLLPDDEVAARTAARQRVSELGEVANREADRAVALSHGDEAALRAKLDALRIVGDRMAARALVPRVGSDKTPEGAYVRAGLDLAADEPVWPSVVDRLRVAARAEPSFGRARAALTYALGRSGDVDGAAAELARDGVNGSSLGPALTAYLERLRKGAKGAPTADGPSAARDAVDAQPRDGARAQAVHGELDLRGILARATAAQAKGEYEKARLLYGKALDLHADDPEALVGLGAISHVRRDLNGARASYRRVLSKLPGYLPALVGLGDVDWDSGDEQAAMKSYGEVVRRFPRDAYPARVTQRLAERSRSSAEAPRSGMDND